MINFVGEPWIRKSLSANEAKDLIDTYEPKIDFSCWDAAKCIHMFDPSWIIYNIKGVDNHFFVKKGNQSVSYYQNAHEAIIFNKSYRNEVPTELVLTGPRVSKSGDKVKLNLCEVGNTMYFSNL